MSSAKSKYLGKHEQVEQMKRIDSFESGFRAFQIAPFELLRFTRGDGEIQLGTHRIQLASIHNAAGRQTFFVCPFCERRVRFLYLPAYKCRSCARLNYRSQQISKGSKEALLSIPAKMGVELPPTELFELTEGYSLPRPYRMKKAKYKKLRRRYQKHEDAFVRREYRRYVQVIHDNGGCEEMAFKEFLYPEGD